MLRKLLKYDIAAIKGVWQIMALSMLGASVIGALSLRYFIVCAESDEINLLAIFAMLFFIACIFAGVATVIVTGILVFLRFYKNLYSDEGYLTFTLPVSRRSILLSKTLNAVIWTALEFALIVVSIGIFLLLAPPMEDGGFIINTVLYEGLFDAIVFLFDAIGVWVIVYALEIILFLAMTVLFTINLVHFCITVGAVIAKRAKLIAGIGIYYGISSALSLVFQLVLIISTMLMANGFAELLTGASKNMICAVIALLILLVCVAFAAPTVAIYYMTLGKIERKLNLA